MSVIFSARSLRDLNSIRDYIGERNLVAASRVSVALMAACDSLEYLPERGRPGLRPGTREITIIWPYIISYRVTEGSVEIIEITHGAQNR